MQEFLVTVIVAWILFRLFRPVVFIQSNRPQKHEHYYYPGPQNHSSEEIKVTKQSPQKKSNNSNEDGEYVDFEELPKS